MTAAKLITETVAPTVGAIIAFFLFLSPAKAVWRTWKSGDIGDLNSLPLVLIAGNCAAWLSYAIVIKDAYVFASNAPGLVMGLAYTMTCLRFEPRQRADVNTIIMMIFGLVYPLLGFLCARPFTEPATQKWIWGIAANVVLLCFYSSPLSTVWHVLATRDSSSLQLPLCAMNCVNGTMWLVYGIAVKDYMIASPNGVGVALAIVQVTLCLLFRRKLPKLPSDRQAIARFTDESNENGSGSGSGSGRHQV